MPKKQIRNDYGTVHVPVDQSHVEEVRDAIEQLTAPMESGTIEVLSVHQIVLLNRLVNQLHDWIDTHTLKLR